jgi:hypothetical protein
MVNVFREITTAIIDNIKLIEFKTGSRLIDIVQNQFSAVYDMEVYKRLSDEWLERLATHMSLVTFKQGEVLSIGELGKGMMVGASIFGTITATYLDVLPV